MVGFFHILRLSWVNLKYNTFSSRKIAILLSQNHRISNGHLVQPLHISRVIPGHIVQVFMWTALDKLQWGRLLSLSGKSVSVLSHLHSKEFILVFRWNFLCISLCPLPLILLLSTTKYSPNSILLTPSLQYLQILIKSPFSSHLSLRLNRHNFLSLSL